MVSKIKEDLYLSTLCRDLNAKFGIFSTYSGLDPHVHTDRLTITSIFIV